MRRRIRALIGSTSWHPYALRSPSSTRSTQRGSLCPLISLQYHRSKLCCKIPSHQRAQASYRQSPQQRVNSAMEGMIGVPAQAVFHSRVTQVHARRGSHGALIPQPASADEYKGKRKSTCSFCGHFMQLDLKRRVPITDYIYRHTVVLQNGGHCSVPKSLCVPVEKMMCGWCSCDVCSSAARGIGLNPPSSMRRLSQSRLSKRRREIESQPQPSADMASDSGSVEAPLNEVLGGGRRDQNTRSPDLSASLAITPPPD